MFFILPPVAHLPAAQLRYLYGSPLLHCHPPSVDMSLAPIHIVASLEYFNRAEEIKEYLPINQILCVLQVLAKGAGMLFDILPSASDLSQISVPHFFKN